jgi:hypothetical protein
MQIVGLATRMLEKRWSFNKPKTSALHQSARFYSLPFGTLPGSLTKRGCARR